MNAQRQEQKIKQLEIKERESRCEEIATKQALDTISTLTNCMSTIVVYTDDAQPFSDVKIKPLYTPGEIAKMKVKVFKALQQL